MILPTRFAREEANRGVKQESGEDEQAVEDENDQDAEYGERNVPACAADHLSLADVFPAFDQLQAFVDILRAGGVVEILLLRSCP